MKVLARIGEHRTGVHDDSNDKDSHEFGIAGSKIVFDVGEQEKFERKIDSQK